MRTTAPHKKSQTLGITFNGKANKKREQNICSFKEDCKDLQTNVVACLMASMCALLMFKYEMDLK